MIQTFFGDKAYAYNLSEGLHVSSNNYFKDPQLSFIKEQMGLFSLVILKQIHSADGLITKEDLPLLRTHEGDFIITNQKQIGIAVLTADCLPIIFYDIQKEVIAIAHAGWRGSVKKIAQKVVMQMQQHFLTDVCDIKVFFGPAARACCYEVSEDFYKENFDDELFKKNIIKKGSSYFFDNGNYNKKQLLEIGVLESALCFDAYLCTLCTLDFCSYRKDQRAQTRNVTVVSLK